MTSAIFSGCNFPFFGDMMSNFLLCPRHMRLQILFKSSVLLAIPSYFSVQVWSPLLSCVSNNNLLSTALAVLFWFTLCSTCEAFWKSDFLHCSLVLKPFCVLILVTLRCESFQGLFSTSYEDIKDPCLQFTYLWYPSFTLYLGGRWAPFDRTWKWVQV